jgi:hypothetical protein
MSMTIFRNRLKVDVMKCPKCGFDQSETNAECQRCGVIFAKLGFQPSGDLSEPGDAAREPAPHKRAIISEPERRESFNRPAPPPARPGAPAVSRGLQDDFAEKESESEVEASPEPLQMHKEDWIVLAVSLGIASVVFAAPLLKHIFNTLMILIHEMGHMIFGWVLGYPSAPAFDLTYGGGVTLHTDRSTLLLIVIYALLAFLVFSFRRNTRAMIFLLTVMLVHFASTITSLNQVLILFMGHGTELLIAGIFFYRALSGAAVVHSVERPLYASIALFIVFSDLTFSYRLMTSPFARAEYADAKGGGHWMDFSRIAIDHLHVNLTSVALVFFLCCLITLPVGFLAFRYQEYLREGLKRLVVRQPEGLDN